MKTYIYKNQLCSILISAENEKIAYQKALTDNISLDNLFFGIDDLKNELVHLKFSFIKPTGIDNLYLCLR